MGLIPRALTIRGQKNKEKSTKDSEKDQQERWEEKPEGYSTLKTK